MATGSKKPGERWEHLPGGKSIPMGKRKNKDIPTPGVQPDFNRHPHHDIFIPLRDLATIKSMILKKFPIKKSRIFGLSWVSEAGVWKTIAAGVCKKLVQRLNS